jgi:DNA ligase (NAD+)
MTRDEAKVRGARRQVSGSVSKKTDFVIVGADPGSKAKKAQEQSVRMILSEGEWLDMIN